MIIYRETARQFRDDVDGNRIAQILEDRIAKRIGYHPTQEIGAFQNSLRAMESVVRKAELPDDCGILLEYKIPLTSRRIDFVVAGEGENASRNFIVVELKQWQDAEQTVKDGIVKTWLHGGIQETTHPSYQAQTYKILLREYNENVAARSIDLSSCAYLHNYRERNPEPLKAATYASIVKDTPLYFTDDSLKLQAFLRQHVGRGKGMDILYDIEAGRIKPSKKLVEHVCGMFKDNPVFTLIDDQKIAYERALELAASCDEKAVLIIKGGPGTGKSVVAVNLIRGLLRAGRNAVFVAPNAAFRDVMVTRLAGDHTQRFLRDLFKGSSSFMSFEENAYDVVVVDEAHRLKDESAYQYRGENQIKDILRASRFTVMFIDESQRVRPEDIGTIKAIKTVARSEGAKVFELELEAQFRCSGADGYLNWLDNTLHIRETANFDGWDTGEFEFRIFDDPNKLRDAIKARQTAGFDARILAGYAWKWTSEKEGNRNGQIEDVVIEEHGFRMPWNSRSARTTWAIDDSGRDQVGCIHTTQGLEFDYVGVIVGGELRFDRETNEFSVDWDSYKDAAGKKNLRNDGKRLSVLVRNIYKVLMSRGMRGCYAYFVDKDVKAYFEERLAPGREEETDGLVRTEPIPYMNALPLLDIRTVADHDFSRTTGVFSEDRERTWLRLEGGPFSRDCFLVRVEGDSMEPHIPDGSICRFHLDRGGSRNQKIVLCAVDQFAGASPIAVVKWYHSERRAEPGDELGAAARITLYSSNPAHPPISLYGEDEFKVLGVFDSIVPDGCSSE